MGGQMSKMFFTKEQEQVARKINLIEFLLKRGYSLQKKGKDYCLTEHDSLIISENNRWNWFSKGVGGRDAVSFLTDYENMPFVEAVLLLSNGVITTSFKAVKPIVKPLILPIPFSNNNRSFMYLTQIRGLDHDLVKELIDNGQIYEESKYHNCVFLGFDEENKPKYGTERGTLPRGKPFRRDAPNSDKSYGFCINGTSDTVYIFESPIDAISHATICKISGKDYKVDYRLSLGGVSILAIDRFLKNHIEIKNVIIGLDNDEVGNAEANKLHINLKERSYTVKREKPTYKDYNEDLLRIFLSGVKET
jgi:hypothetical protein